MDEQHELFVNRHEAVKHLKAQGFKISKTKVYQDSRAGRLRIQANGTVLMEDLAAYKNSLFQPSTWGGADDWREIAKLMAAMRRRPVEYHQHEIVSIGFRYMP